MNKTLNLKKILNRCSKFQINHLAEVYGCLARRKKKMIKLLLKTKLVKHIEIDIEEGLKHH